MKKWLTVLLTISMCLSCFSMPTLAVSPQTITLDDSGSSMYAIVSENYVGKWSDYQTYYYDFAPNASNLFDIRFRVKATYRYNEATGKIYGSAGTLKIEAYTKSYNYDISIDNIDYSPPTITSDGYAWEYADITFDFTISYNGTTPETYSTGIGTQYVPG